MYVYFIIPFPFLFINISAADISTLSLHDALPISPFTLALPYVDMHLTGILIVIIGLIISSAFPSILVYAQELLPKKLGMVSGLFYGFAFGMGGVGSAVLGLWADATSIQYIYHICSFLPLIGVIAYFLPNMKKVKYKDAE